MYYNLQQFCFQAIERELIRTSPGGLKYVGEYKAGRVEPKMDHLGCFCGKHFCTIKLQNFQTLSFFTVTFVNTLKLQTKRIYLGVIPPNEPRCEKTSLRGF